MATLPSQLQLLKDGKSGSSAVLKKVEQARKDRKAAIIAAAKAAVELAKETRLKGQAYRDANGGIIGVS